MLFWVFIIVIVVVSITAKQNRRHAAMMDRKTCTYCHAVYAADARFCGRCGRSL